MVLCPRRSLVECILSPSRVSCSRSHGGVMSTRVVGYFRLATARKNLNELDAAADVLKVSGDN